MQVRHWKYNDGNSWIPEILRKNIADDTEFEQELVGWPCWVVADNIPGDAEFVTWMKNNMIGSYECDWRFNNGDPMYTVHIRSDEDATAFKLRWM